MCRKSKFTLLELLIVIAIISILLTLLLPSLSNARESAKNLLCLNNLKTVGIATFLYTDESDGWVVPNTLNTGTNDRWAKYSLFRELNGWDSVNPVWMIPNEGACPKARERCLKENVDYNTASIKDLRCYGPFAIYGGQPHRIMRLLWIKDPSSMGYAGDVWAGWQFSINDFAPRHKNKANIIYFDGHVKSQSNSFISSNYNSSVPWADSEGDTLTNYNDRFH